MAGGHARATRPGRRGQRPPGPGADQHDDRAGRGGEEPDPGLVLAGETPAAALTSNFRIDQHGLVESVGAIADRVHSPRDRRRRRRSARSAGG